MRVLPALRFIWRLRLSGVVLAGLVGTTIAAAQPIQLGFGNPARPELMSAQVNEVSGTTAARLEQARALATDKNWDEAVDILRDLAAEGSDAVVDVGGGRFVSLRTYCHLQLAGLPNEALATYRRLVDPLAERWYRDGLAARDERLLGRLVDELFCSSWGDDALLALGELALERADYAAARRHWEQISPLLRDPTGRPMWLALREIDFDAHWPQVERRWLQRPQSPVWLAYPDTDLALADVRARLILASIRAGELNRATLELDVFRRLHPDAAGRLAGQAGPYVPALDRLLDSARDWPAPPREVEWPTFAGSPSRSPAVPKLGPITGPAWPDPVQLSHSRIVRGNQRANITIGGRRFVARAEAPALESAPPLSCFPVVENGAVLFSDATRIRAVELATGQPAITSNGVLHRDETSEPSSRNIGVRFGRGLNLLQVAAYGVPRYTLSVIDGVVYGRVGSPATERLDSRQPTAGDRLVGLDLKRDGLLAFSARPENASWAFDGVPVGDGRRLFVALRKSDVTPHAYVACFDAATGGQLWRTSIGAADMPDGGQGDQISHNLLTLVGDRIYFNTNLGLVAALDAETGDVCWIRRYDRVAGGAVLPGQALALHFDRDPAPCLVHQGLVIAAPSDTTQIFALDADTGQTVWSTDKLPDALHLLGVVRHNLMVSGNRLAALDVRSGQLKFTWPESEHAGIRGMGRGVVAGDEVFWPTRNEIYVIHGVTGARSRTPIDLRTVSNSGANLAAAQGRLIVAGYDKLMAFGPALPVPPNRNRSKNEPIATAESTSLTTGR